MKVAIVLGTRPEIIKMSPLIRECEKRSLDYFVVHSEQHYSNLLDKVFFKQLHLPKPKYRLGVGSGTHAEQTGKAMMGTEQILSKNKPDVVLVHGDTNTTIAAALAAAKLHIPVGHVESGLRSYDRSMPEEVNRVLVDHCSDYLLAPTVNAKEILKHEGISETKIFVTGNTVVDALYQNIQLSENNSSILDQLHVSPREYFLVTVHRQENVDNLSRFRNIMKGLELLSKEFSIPVIYPIHPRSKKMMERFHIGHKNVTLVEPLDYQSFLKLEHHAKLVLTDSGGVQEEACVMRVPCVTLRDNTERPETVDVGANMTAGTEPQSILASVNTMLKRRKSWKNPFGNGHASTKIIDILEQFHS